MKTWKWCWFIGACLIAFGFPAAGFCQLMDKNLEARLDKAAPKLFSIPTDDDLHGRSEGIRLFFTGNEIPHAHQDVRGGTTTFFLSKHSYAANPDGLPGTSFEFPWRHPAGTDKTNGYSWRVMYLPPNTKVRVHWTTLHSYFSNERNVKGYGWTFPIGTRFFELLSFGDRLRVFEVRVRTKTERGWRMALYRPFPTRQEYVAATGFEIVSRNWQLVAFGDARTHRNLRSLGNLKANVEVLYGLSSAARVDRLLEGRTFKNAMHQEWDENCVAPTTQSDTSIVPANYEGAFAGNTQKDCMRCHQDAAKHVRFFDARREWYGFIRGEKEERILSFHPIDKSSLSNNGAGWAVQLNRKMIDAGVIEWRP